MIISETSLSFCNYEPGYTLPLLECASGHAYLAHVPDAERLNLLAGLDVLDRRSHMLEMFKGDKLVRRIREDGYATCDRNPHAAVPGKTSPIGVPVFESSRVAGALSLVFFATAMPMAEAVRRYAQDLLASATAISEHLTRDLAEQSELVPSDGMVVPLPRRQAALQRTHHAAALN